MRTLDYRILKKLSKMLGKREGTIRKDVSKLANEYPNCTSNARAQIYALKHGKTVRRFLDREDKASLPNIELVRPIRVLQEKVKKKRKERIIQFVKYPTSNPFRQAHIEEVNRAYTCKCYTSAFIVCRKIIENLIADFLRLKFPDNTKENKELYYDIHRNRIKDFKDLLSSLESKRVNFEMEKRLVEKIISCVKPFKEEADQKTHSWYHIVKTKAEIDKMDIQNIFDLLYELEKKLIQQQVLASKSIVITLNQL